MKNEKIETIRRRERRNDIIFGIISVPMIYAMIVMIFCL